MKTYPLSLIIHSVFLLINISSSSNCHGPESQQPCKCFIGKYQCRYNKCEWQFSKCIETEVATSTTDFPTYQPTSDPFANTVTVTVTHSNHDILDLTCGDTIHNTWHNHDLTFKLNLSFNTQSIQINACNSNFDTILKLYQHSHSYSPIYADDNACDNGYSSSLINVENGLSAGIYFLLLSANTLTDTDVQYEYELQILCTVETNHTDKSVQKAALCESNCDAFSVKLLYYGLLNEYNTSHIFYDRRLLQLQNEDIVCYTYGIQRLFDDGICMDSVESIVLGTCQNDYNKMNSVDLDALIVKQYGGGVYTGYNGVGISEITGVEIDVNVDDVAKEFTLCMRGVNDHGNVSHVVQFKRGGRRYYLCDDDRNDGLPCLNDMKHIEMETMQAPESRIFSHILQGILLIALSVMIVIAVLYLFITVQKGKPLKTVVLTDIDWAEINVSDTLSSTEEVHDKLSDVSDSTDDEADPLSDDQADTIAVLKENLQDLNNKFVHRNRNNKGCRSYRSSISSVRSDNDGCAILPLYQEYDNDDHFFDDTMSENGYFLNTDAYIDDGSKSDTI